MQVSERVDDSPRAGKAAAIALRQGLRPLLAYEALWRLLLFVAVGPLAPAVITSLEYRGLQEVWRLEPRLRTGYIVSASLGDLTRLDVDFLSVRAGLVTPALRRQSHARGWDLHAWTANDRPTLQALLDRDVDNLITDDVPLAREVLRTRAALPDGELILSRLHAWMRSGRG